MLDQDLRTKGIINCVLEKLSTHVQSDGVIAENIFVQLCNNHTARYSLGIFTNTNADLALVQRSLQSWKNKHLYRRQHPDLAGYYLSCPLSLKQQLLRKQHQYAYQLDPLSRPIPIVSARASKGRTICATTQVVSRETCATLATQCGITPAQFTTDNPSATECSTLAVGEHVCCSVGTLPNYAPQPAANGDCYSYLVVSGVPAQLLRRRTTSPLRIAQPRTLTYRIRMAAQICSPAIISVLAAAID